MKVSSIYIKNFHQFDNLFIDLTYPSGHAKKGQPLDKVCIIGQNGSGKTTILNKLYELIKQHTSIKPAKRSLLETLKEKYGDKYLIEDDFTDLSQDFLCEISMVDNVGKGEFLSNKDKSLLYSEYSKPIALYIEDQIRDVDDFIFSKPNNWKKISDISDTIDKLDIEKRQTYWERIINTIQNSKTLSLNELGWVFWEFLFMEIDNYDYSFSEKAKELLSQGSVKGIEKFIKRYNEWKRNTPNPRQELAEKCINPIIKEFNLEVDLDSSDGYVVLKRTNSDKNIQARFLSSGTKQFLKTAIPIYYLNHSDCIFLVDEPENSLYPNLQFKLVDYYSSLAPNSQFIYATHSPLIAASFEPWEIVELKFDERGFVYQDEYYEGERHVDNYTINPNYLTYDLILSKVFDLKETYPAIRDEKLNEVLMLRNQLEKLKKENKLSSTDGKKLYGRYMKLAKQLSWEFELPNYAEA